MDTNNNLKAVNTFGVNGLLSRYTGNGTSGSSVYYTFDMQGNPSQRLDNLGNILSTHLFDAYGIQTSTVASSVLNDPYAGFGSQWGYYLDETGLTLLGYRYYDAGRGRFLSRDPIGYEGGTNLYSYAGNDPVNVIDPSGLRGEGFFSWRTVGSVLARIGGAIIGGPLGAAAGVALFEGVYTYADTGSVSQAVVHGAVAGAVTYGGGVALGKLGSWIGRTGIAQKDCYCIC